MERPIERRTAARTAVVWDDLSALLGDEPWEVLDVGGGTGTMAVRVAELGHRVTVVDPSPDALAALHRRAGEREVADRVRGVQGHLADVPGLLDSPADLVLCHGLLGLLDDPAAALGTLGEVLAPGGTLSLLIGQRHAAVLARAMVGHFTAAGELLAGSDEGEHRFTVSEITELVRAASYSLVSVHAVRVFADLVPATLLDLEPQAHTALLELERAVADRPEYATLATQLHVLATT